MKRLFVRQSMIPTLLSGAKTQHRVPLRHQPTERKGFPGEWMMPAGRDRWNTNRQREQITNRATGEVNTREYLVPLCEWLMQHCPYKVGDEVWCPETWASDVPGCESQRGITYRAAHLDPRGDGPTHPIKWRSPATMPRWAARIFRTVKAVRVELARDISEADAIAEGCTPRPNDCDICAAGVCSIHQPPRGQFLSRWKGERNDWVWVLDFEEAKR